MGHSDHNQLTNKSLETVTKGKWLRLEYLLLRGNKISKKCVKALFHGDWKVIKSICICNCQPIKSTATSPPSTPRCSASSRPSSGPSQSDVFAFASQ